MEGLDPGMHLFNVIGQLVKMTMTGAAKEAKVGLDLFMDILSVAPKVSGNARFVVAQFAMVVSHLNMDRFDVAQ